MLMPSSTQERRRRSCRRAPRRTTRHSSQVRQRRDRDHRTIARHRPLRGPDHPRQLLHQLNQRGPDRRDGHTVLFSATETIITDDNDRYRLTYPRVPNSREWTVSMQANAGDGRPIQAPPGPPTLPQLTITAIPELDAGTAAACAT